MTLGSLVPNIDSCRRERTQKIYECVIDNSARVHDQRAISAGQAGVVASAEAVEALLFLGDYEDPNHVTITTDTTPELTVQAPSGWTAVDITIDGTTYPLSAAGGGLFRATTAELVCDTYAVTFTGTDDGAGPVFGSGSITITACEARLLMNSNGMLYRNGNAMLLRKSG